MENIYGLQNYNKKDLIVYSEPFKSFKVAVIYGLIKTLCLLREEAYYGIQFLMTKYFVCRIKKLASSGYRLKAVQEVLDKISNKDFSDLAVESEEYMQDVQEVAESFEDINQITYELNLIVLAYPSDFEDFRMISQHIYSMPVLVRVVSISNGLYSSLFCPETTVGNSVDFSNKILKDLQQFVSSLLTLARSCDGPENAHSVGSAAPDKKDFDNAAGLSHTKTTGNGFEKFILRNSDNEIVNICLYGLEEITQMCNSPNFTKETLEYLNLDLEFTLPDQETIPDDEIIN
jgi:hypothetical protein